MKDRIARLLDQIEEAPIVTVTPIFAWYDLWVGVYIDRTKRTIYVLPLPCIGLKITWQWVTV